MKKKALTLLLVLAVVLVAMAYPEGEARRRMALRAQSLRNLTPGRKDVADEIRRIADSLGDGGRDAFYFSTLNVLSDQLFSEGRFSQADKVAREMDREAAGAHDRLSRAISRRLRGQMFFKLSQPQMALHELDTALMLSPGHELDLNAFSTHTSINEWRSIVAMQLKDTLKAIGAMRSYRSAVDYWRSVGWQDSTRHFEVTALAYEADEELWHGDKSRAAHLLDKAAGEMLSGLPSRAYEHYYYARLRLNVKTETTGRLSAMRIHFLMRIWIFHGSISGTFVTRRGFSLRRTVMRKAGTLRTGSRDAGFHVSCPDKPAACRFIIPV